MTKRKDKFFLKIYYAKAETLEESVRARGRLVHVLSADTKETRTLLEAIGVEFSPEEWSDYEDVPEEMGFKTPKKRK